jgi:hypothetical protein
VDRQLVDDAGLRRPDVDPLQLVHRRDFSLNQLGDFGSDIGKLFCHFAAYVLIDLDDLQLDLGNFSFRLSDGGD